MSNKPSWERAPDWAEWLAMDEDYQWRWYENKPTWRFDTEVETVCGQWQTDGEWERAAKPDIIWQNTLEPRPLNFKELKLSEIASIIRENIKLKSENENLRKARKKKETKNE